MVVVMGGGGGGAGAPGRDGVVPRVARREPRRDVHRVCAIAFRVCIRACVIAVALGGGGARPLDLCTSERAGPVVSMMYVPECALPLDLCISECRYMMEDGDDAVIWRGPRKNGLITKFLTDVEWGELDYLVVDSAPPQPLPLQRALGCSRAGS